MNHMDCGFQAVWTLQDICSHVGQDRHIETNNNLDFHQLQIFATRDVAVCLICITFRKLKKSGSESNKTIEKAS